MRVVAGTLPAMSSPDVARLESLSRGFRSEYLDHAALTAQLHAWADAFPHLCRVRSIGRTPEGRDLWVVTIGPEPDRVRPSVFVDGNMHASELCGSSVALAIAEDLLRLHLDPEAPLHDLSPSVKGRLLDVLVHVLPRTSPDGAESILKTRRYCRSNPRDRRPNRQHARWISQDLDGDGLALSIRKQDETGEFVESSLVPDLMLPRTPDDPGPYYKLWPEGVIEGFDGATIPDPGYLGDNDVDLNRNFPWSWTPEPEQIGAGAYAASEPESRAIVELVTGAPEIFAWVNYHTFGGVFIRPLGHEPDSKMDPQDLALFRQIEAWADELTSYPTVSGYEEFLYEPDKPLHGDLSDFSYHQRCAISYVVELWDLFAQLGIPRRKRFVEHYTHMTRDELVRLGRWDAEHNQRRVVRPWRRVAHPQLGEVEVGGLDPTVGISNPPYEQLARVCAEHASHTLRVAALAPRVVIERLDVTPVDGDVRRVELVVANHGYLPTHVLSSAKKLPWNEPLHVTLRTEGCVVEGESRRELGHLDGFGRGLANDETSIFHYRSRGSTGRRTARFFVRGRGRVVVRVGSCRTGFVERAVDVAV